MEMHLWVPELLRKTKFDDVDLNATFATFANSHEEIVRLDISMDKIARVNIFDTWNQLIHKQQDSFEAEFAVAEVE